MSKAQVRDVLSADVRPKPVGSLARASADDEIAAFTARLGKMGYVWQFLPIAGMWGLAVGAERMSRAIKERGVQGYREEVLLPAKSTGSTVVSKSWMGGDLADAMGGAVAIL